MRCELRTTSFGGNSACDDEYFLLRRAVDKVGVEADYAPPLSSLASLQLRMTAFELPLRPVCFIPSSGPKLTVDAKRPSPHPLLRASTQTPSSARYPSSPTPPS